MPVTFYVNLVLELVKDVRLRADMLDLTPHRSLVDTKRLVRVIQKRVVTLVTCLEKFACQHPIDATWQACEKQRTVKHSRKAMEKLRLCSVAVGERALDTWRQLKRANLALTKSDA